MPNSQFGLLRLAHGGQAIRMKNPTPSRKAFQFSAFQFSAIAFPILTIQ
jgi:hypothetical protein